MREKRFQDIFSFPFEAVASAHGRVNVLGEHTDYNEGYVLPTAIPQKTSIELARSRDGNNHCYAAVLNKLVSWPMEGPPPDGFGCYVMGCLHLLIENSYSIAPVTMTINSDVPMGAGLSSSAALEVAVLRGMRVLFDLDVDDVAIAKMAQQAEIRFAHVNCGIMDQMAASLADTEHMLFLDTRTLETRLIPLPPEAELIVIDSGVSRSLSKSAYNKRREECESAAKALAVPALRYITDETIAEVLPEPLLRRARHVISENNRVLEAAKGVSASRLGELMNASHLSLRNDFEVSIPALDLLVDLLQKTPCFFGARLTGAGFGGSCVALARKGKGRKEAMDRVMPAYQKAGYQGRILVG